NSRFEPEPIVCGSGVEIGEICVLLCLATGCRKPLTTKPVEAIEPRAVFLIGEPLAELGKSRQCVAAVQAAGRRSPPQSRLRALVHGELITRAFLKGIRRRRVSTRAIEA